MIIDDVPTHFTNKHAVSMSLRDYFAAKAMQAMTHRGESNQQFVSEQAYLMADAMLKAREA
jgi:hypothetical protein